MKILLLAGTAEARALAALLAAEGHEVTASLAGATRAPADQRVTTRTGGFGGAAGLAGWLSRSGVEAVIDATHPFADQMPHHAANACDRLGLPRLRLMRPAWPVEPGWLTFPTLTAALAGLPAGARVLCTTGRLETLPMRQRVDLRFWLRSIEPVRDLPPHITPILARPPFSLAEEVETMTRHRITHLLTKNAGGARAKLEAAALTGAAVLMISRPLTPPGPHVQTPQEAVAWIAQLVADGTPPR